jgi:type II secretory pathway component GspD/PulD (secretin)
MNTITSLGVFGLMAVETAALVGFAAVAHRQVQRGVWQRAIWISLFPAVLLVFGFHWAGMENLQWDRLSTTEWSGRKMVVRFGPASTQPGTAEQRSTDNEAATVTPVIEVAAKLPAPPAWPIWLWLGGTIVLLGRQAYLIAAIAHALRCHCRAAQSEIMGKVSSLARRLGYRAPVRVLASSGLSGPVALGCLRPTILLPLDFGVVNSPLDQEAMLAHELAHLDGRDPVWLLIADVAIACFWWQPWLWWARRRLRMATELAADEASVRLEGGPVQLAGCLVTLAKMWQRQRTYRWLGVAGFGSDLGHRVERLLKLDSQAAKSRLLPWSTWICLGASSSLIALVMLITTWVVGPSLAAEPRLRSMIDNAFASSHAREFQVDKPQRRLHANAQHSKSKNSESVDSTTGQTTVAEVRTELAVSPATEVFSPPPLLPANGGSSPAAASSNAAVAGVVNRGSALDLANTNLPARTTRMFKVDPNVLRQNLAALTGRPVDPDHILEPLREFFALSGVDWEADADLLKGTNIFVPDARQEGVSKKKALFYSHRTGMLLVRASVPEIDDIERIVQVLNRVEPQIMIEAKFVDIKPAETKGLGFDWYLATNMTNKVASMDDAAATAVLKPEPRASAEANAVQELRGDELEWSGRSLSQAHNALVTAAIGVAERNILTDVQARGILRALEQRSGVDVLSAPRLTTLSGRQAQIQVSELKQVVMGINHAALVQNGPPSGSNVAALITASIPTGPTLDVIPEILSDGTIRLNLTASVVEFLGYDETQKTSSARVWENGSKRTVKTYPPRFRIRQVQTTSIIPDGRTLVLGTFPVAIDPKAATGSKRKSAEPTSRLLVFVTAQQIDPAGNPVSRSVR